MGHIQIWLTTPVRNSESPRTKKVSPVSWHRRWKYLMPPLKSPGQGTENLSNPIPNCQVKREMGVGKQIKLHHGSTEG